MQLNNPFQMNDWEIRRFFTAVLAIQFSVWSVIGLDAIGLHIPIVRQLITFIYLTFVPGIIILRILKVHKLGNIETLLYTVGLSLATLMFTGLFMNTVYPFFGIFGPISTTPLIITISAVVLALCILSYVRDKDFSDPNYIDIKEALSPPALFSCLIPFLAVFGTYLVNFYHINILLMILIAIIASVAGLIAFDKFIPESLYPLAVVTIAIALLYTQSLITMYLWGWDIHGEYYLQTLVIKNAYWDSSIPSNLNVCLSIAMLSPLYSILLNVDGTWIFKIGYPLFFSLVPLALFQVYKKQTDSKTAFFAAFFFMSLFTFFSEMLQLARQQIAELFFALSILLMIDRKMNPVKRTALLIVFGFSLVVSHYGLSYFYMFYLIISWFLLLLMSSSLLKNLKERLNTRFIKFKDKIGIKNKQMGSEDSASKMNLLNGNFVALYIVLALSWYLYTTSSSSFNGIVHVGKDIYRGIFTDLFNPETRDPNVLLAIGGSLERESIQYKIYRYLNYIIQFFIIVGFIRLIAKHKEIKFHLLYMTMAFVSMIILLLSIFIPFFSGKLGMGRTYHIALFLLAPLCIIGGETVFEMASFGRYLNTSNNSFKKIVVLAILIPYFLFTTGFILQITGETPQKIALSINEIDSPPHFNDREIFGAKWLSDKSADNLGVYADSNGLYALLVGRWVGKQEKFPADAEQIKEGYLYLRSWNIEKNEILILTKPKAQPVKEYINLQNDPVYFVVINSKNKIYDNGGSQILL